MPLDSTTQRKLRFNTTKNDFTYKNNRAVSEKIIYKVVDEKALDLENRVRDLTQDLIDRQVGFLEWQRGMVDLLRLGHTEMMRFGKGGRDLTYANDYLDVAKELKDNQYPKLRDFSIEIAEGKVSEKQILNRAAMYAKTSRNSYEKGKMNRQPNNVRGKRILGACFPHHPNCLEYAALGWQKLEDIVLPLEHPNCCCTMRYSSLWFKEDSDDNLDLDKTYNDYHKLVNMSYSQLKSWSQTKYSKAASLDRSPILRNLELLNTKKSNWTKKHIRWANKTIAFISRMKQVKKGENVSKDIPYSKRDISLKNWAFSP